MIQQLHQDRCSQIYVPGCFQRFHFFLPSWGSILTWPTVTASHLIFLCPVLPLSGKTAQNTNLITSLPGSNHFSALLPCPLSISWSSELAMQSPRTCSLTTTLLSKHTAKFLHHLGQWTPLCASVHAVSHLLCLDSVDSLSIESPSFQKLALNTQYSGSWFFFGLLQCSVHQDGIEINILDDCDFWNNFFSSTDEFFEGTALTVISVLLPFCKLLSSSLQGYGFRHVGLLILLDSSLWSQSPQAAGA